MHQIEETAREIAAKLPELPYNLDAGKLFYYIGYGLPWKKARTALRLVVSMKLISDYKGKHGWFRNPFSYENVDSHRLPPEDCFVPLWWDKIAKEDPLDNHLA